MASLSCSVAPVCSHACSVLLELPVVFLCLLQSGPGGGVGAAAGAEGPSRKSQRVLGAPWSDCHQPLLGHQRPPCLCGRLWRQSVLSPCRLFQSRQGSGWAPCVEEPLSAWLLANRLLVRLCVCAQGPLVIFPVQTVTTVDSRVVQLGYQDGRLLVSSLSRCYLCDTER